VPKRLITIGGAALIAIVLLILAVVSGGDKEPPATAVAAPPSTAAPVTTTLPPPTVPPLTFSGDGAEPEIDALVEALYRSVAEGTPLPPLPEALAAHIGGAAAPPPNVQATTLAADLKYGQRVAVVRAGDDSILMADETEGWKIVGADMPSLGLEPWYGPPIRTVLIVGSDARWNDVAERSRSDSLHIVTAVPASGAGAIVGIPRDSWVVTPSGGRGKITDILANHGPEGIFETVAAVSNEALEGWILTGFLGFETISRAFGPFEIDLPIRVPAGNSLPGFPEGPQVVEPPEKLLLLARIRKTLPNGDFSRSFNHGVIMQGALREVRRRGIEDLPELIQILDDSSFTSFSAGELLNLGATALLLDPDNVTNVVIPGSVGTTSGGASIVSIGGGADAVFADQADNGLLDGSTG
jgi:anionic cell wall polymer biosynthesis LytR-Cps2A-Psr (LCP) family protein